LVDTFYYPSLGTGLIYQTIVKKISKKYPVLLNSFPVKIRHKRKKIEKVTLNSKKVCRPEFLVTSIPINELVALIDPSPPKEVLLCVKKLRFRSQVFVFITLNKNKITDDQWIYFPDANVPIARLSEMKNFSRKMSPPGKTSLTIEYFCWEGDKIWNLGKKDLFELTIGWLEKLKLSKRKDVINFYIIKTKNTYPVYDLEYESNLRVVREYLDSFSNLIYVGRLGRFKYTNQDHSLEMGILAAKSITEKKKIDFENVGSEMEYFEKGYVK